jgi:hypothetical protein
MKIRLNEVDDAVLDAAAMRTLAQGDRFHLLERLRRAGPGEAAELAANHPEDITALAEVGLIEQRQGRWSAVGRGLYFEVPDDPTDLPAARALLAIWMLSMQDVPQRWAAEHQPHLEAEWLRACGLLNAGMVMTPAELEALQADLERLIEPYVNRTTAPESGRRVRVLSYFLPARSHR